MTETLRLPLNTLPAFCAVARQGNLRAAAAALHLTHSAVSQQLRLLEERVGAPLFDRVGRGLVLNAAGRSLLRAAEAALSQLDAAARDARAVAGAGPPVIRLSLLPSFAQRWLLPRMARWRAREPDIGLELHTSQQVVDLASEGFHAAIRQGSGHWPGLLAEPLNDAPRIAVGSPQAAHRLDGRPMSALADQPLLGSAELWSAWFQLAGAPGQVRPVAVFNDVGLMLQAVEQDIGVALVREVLAVDGLASGRLVKLSSVTLPGNQNDGYWLAYPSVLHDWPPLAALRGWILDELAQAQAALPVQSHYALRHES